MKMFLALLVVVGLVAFVTYADLANLQGPVAHVQPVAASSKSALPSPDAVTLRAAPGNTVVQMFDSVGVDAAVLRQYPSGERCTRISGPSAVSIEGIAMRFYKLYCNGASGYVNAQWVEAQ